MVDATQDDVGTPLLAELVEGDLHTVDRRTGARPHLRLTDILTLLQTQEVGSRERTRIARARTLRGTDEHVAERLHDIHEFMDAG